MKKLVLGSLLLAAIATQATGCIITTEDDDPGEAAFITADWTFRNIATQSNTGCPAGFGTVALHNQEVDLDNRPIPGTEVIDLFDCIDGRHESAPLDPVVYETWLEVTSSGGASVYAESLSAIVDVTQVDKTFSATILNDGGYFQVAWDLRGATTNNPLQCRDVANLDGVEIISTVTGGTQAVVDKFDCENGIDISGGLLQGSYTVSVDAFDDAAGALGPPVNLTNRTIKDRNGVTDLGRVTLPITGK
jgi:hypothetical protein